MTDNAKRTGAAIEAHYQFLTWLVPAVEKFPKAHKFTLGDRIQSIALDVLEALIEATYTRERTAHLRRANLGIEKLRFLLRLAADLRLLDRKRYEHAARSLDETGRLIGGWMKADKASRPRPNTHGVSRHKAAHRVRVARKMQLNQCMTATAKSRRADANVHGISLGSPQYRSEINTIDRSGGW